MGQGVMQMNCAWKSFVSLLPAKFKVKLEEGYADQLEELRLRCGQAPELVLHGSSVWLEEPTTSDDLGFVINAASRYSPWAASTIRRGYITASGGHRIGLCGEAVVQNGEMTGIRNPSSVNIRIARDFPGIAKSALRYKGSVLIIGRPGSGKSTLLRDLIRQRSDHGPGCVAVVDERGELFPCIDQQSIFFPGRRTDILSGCGKSQGIDCLLRTMGPRCIAVDEITAEEDCNAMLNAGWSGVHLLATAHAEDLSDLYDRPIYRPLVQSKLFDTVLILGEDKSWIAERMRT